MIAILAAGLVLNVCMKKEKTSEAAPDEAGQSKTGGVGLGGRGEQWAVLLVTVVAAGAFVALERGFPGESGLRGLGQELIDGLGVGGVIGVLTLAFGGRLREDRVFVFFGLIASAVIAALAFVQVATTGPAFPPFLWGAWGGLLVAMCGSAVALLFRQPVIGWMGSGIIVLLAVLADYTAVHASIAPSTWMAYIGGAIVLVALIVVILFGRPTLLWGWIRRLERIPPQAPPTVPAGRERAGGAS